jgi:predicted SAM-dependent methyltransferase
MNHKTQGTSPSHRPGKPGWLRAMLRKRTSKGLRRSLRSVIAEVKTSLMHRKGIRQARRCYTGTDLKLNLGCGANFKDGFVNIDFHKRSDLRLDLREELPFPADSCALVYSEHFFEHLDYPEDAISFLRESWRILKPGGIFSVGVPDAEWPVRAYVGDPQYAGWFEVVKGEWYPKWCTTKMDCVNFSFRQGNEHRYAYDFDTLKHVLETVGFVEVRRRVFNPDLDTKRREYTTLYVDAVKPDHPLTSKA